MQRGQIYKLPSGAWAYRFRDAVGDRRQIGGFRTKGEAREQLEHTLERVRRGPLYKPEMTLAELVERFLAQYDAAPATVSWIRYHLGKAVKAFGADAIGSLDPAEIGAWRKTLPEASRHQTIRVLRQVLGAAVRWRWIDHNAAREVENPQARRGEIVPFDSWEQIDAVAAELGARFGPIPVVGAGTGLRPEELFALEWRDVSLSERALTVRRAWSKGRLTEWSKTDASRRRIPLRSRVVDALEWVDHRRGVVFRASEGGRVNLDNWRRRDWRPAVLAAGIEPHRRPYDLRHTYATWSLAAGVGLFTLARRMGTSLKMIDQTYGHLAIDADDYERDLLDAWDAPVEMQFASDGHEMGIRPRREPS